MSIQIKLKNTVVQDRTPGDSDLPQVGELALNANINSIGGFMRASDNNIVKIFGPGSVTTPTATTTVSGISELATNSETTTGTATNRVVTPAGLNAVTVAERTTSNTNYVAKAGSTMTGVLTATAGSNSAPSINFGDSDSGIFGGTNTVSLAAGGTTRLTADTGVSVVGTLAVTGAITSTSDLTIPDKIIHSGDTNTAIRFPAADTVSVETGGSERARVDSSGRLLIGTSTAQTSRIDANTFDPLLQITSNIEAATSITRFSNTTDPSRFSLQKSRGTIASPVIVQDNDVLGEMLFSGWDGDTFTNGAKIIAAVDGTPGDDDMPSRLVFSTTADGAATSTTRLTIDSAGLVKLPDNGKFVAGAGDDLQLYHNGTDSFLQNYVGNLKVAANSLLLTNRDTDETYISCTDNDAVKLYFNNNLKFETTDTGVSVTGAITATGNLTISSNKPTIVLTEGDANPDYQIFSQGGAFKIKDSTNAVDRLTVNTDGHIDIAGNLDVGAGIDCTGEITSTSHIDLPDDAKLKLGTGDDLEIYHNGSNSFIDNTNGNLEIRSNEVRIKDYSEGDNMIYASRDGEVRLYFAGSEKFNTTSDGATITGRLTPAANNTYGLGTSSLRFANFFSVNGDFSGQVGIGTTSPTDTLHVFHATDNLVARFESGDTGGGITLKDNTHVTSLITTNGAFEINVDQGGDITGESIDFKMSGSSKMLIDSSGNVGIGTTPDSNFKLDVNGAARIGNTTDGIIIENSTSSAAVANACRIHRNGSTGSLNLTAGTTTARDMIFNTKTSAGESMRITSSGNLGIGTTSVSNIIHATGSNSGTGYQFINTHSTTGFGVRISGGGTTADRYALRVDDAASNERFRINANGNVGIGTNSPIAKFDVTDGTTSISFNRTSNTPRIDFKGNNVSEICQIKAAESSGGGVLQLFTKTTGGTATERMRIDSSGRAGIGITSIASSTRLALSESSGNAQTLEIIAANNTGAGSQPGIKFTNNSGGNTGGIFADTNSGQVRIQTGGNAAINIDSNQNVGIGLSAIAGRVHAHSAANTATFIADGEVDNPQYPSYGFAGQNADNGSRGAGMYLPGDNTLAFATAGNERVRISGDGFVSIGNTSAQGSRLFIDSSGVSQNTLRLKQSHSTALIHFNEVTNTSYVGDGYKYHGSRTAGSNYNFMAFDSGHASTPDREFTIRGDGNAFADGTWNNNGADYAEFFESSTGSAIPVGTAVVLDNNKVRAATSSDAVGNIIGVVRPKEPGQASMTIGNTAWNKWQGKYLTDDFDRFILDEHNVINWTEADGTFHSYESHAIPSDVTVPSDAQTLTEDVNGNKFTHYRLNPDYDSSKTYVPRSDRDEWIIVGLVGQVKVLKGQAVNDRWVKMKDVSDTVEEYFIR